MPIFDRYIAVDWSANNGPKSGKDSIWIGEATPSGLTASRNPTTRALAMADIESTLLSSRSRGERIIVGFDFVFGFPAGAAEAIAQATSPSSALRAPSPTRGEGLTGNARQSPSPLMGEGGRRPDEGGPLAPWSQLWSALFNLIRDSSQNLSNRFDVAAAINRATTPRFWGHPHGRTIPGLAPTRATADYTTVSERRRVESRIRGPQPVWKLTGVGAVGSQTLLGIPRLEALRRHPTLGRDIAVWPFDTDFDRTLNAPITLVEIYPSLFPLALAAEPKDRAQVETCVLRYAALDATGLLSTFLSAPPDLSPTDHAIAVAEEGWIAGVGHAALWQQLREAA